MTSESADNNLTSSSDNHEQSDVARSSTDTSDNNDDTSRNQQCSDVNIIPPELIQRLSARLETGLDRNDNLDDPFLKSIKKDHVYVIARKYTRDTSIVQPALMEMINQKNPQDQLERLKVLKEEKEDEECLWVNILGIEEKVICGITDLCGLPKSTIMDHLTHSENRHHRSHLEIHPSYMYIQLLIQDTPKSMAETPIYDMVKNVFKADKCSMSDERSGNGNGDVDVEKMIRRGFLSVFVIPSLNILFTITHSYYDCPASRVVVRSIYVDMAIPGEVDIVANAQLLGLSMVHRTIGFCSTIVQNVDKRLSDWEDQLKIDFSSISTEEVHRLVVHLQEFKKRLKPMSQLNDKLSRHYAASRAVAAEQETDENLMRMNRKAVMMLEQGKETLGRVMEDTEDLLEKGKNLENYCFNMLSTRANDSMERLAIVTIVFLPLTFIASYFSMGFERFADLSRSPIYFWEISIPLSFAFFLIFAYSSLKRGLTRLSHVVSRFRRWMKKQTKWWKLDIILWWRRKRDRWNENDGERKFRQEGKGQP
ncbi:hypothetical protein V865_004035 [Kwoniella europaea PYCC6329]|uniref:Magnesium transporter n=1 Tax=Kwoniella europaea PYCC6329 TaxID=1423913 RepID=A0AAX4KK07_9TREE